MSARLLGSVHVLQDAVHARLVLDQLGEAGAQELCQQVVAAVLATAPLGVWTLVGGDDLVVVATDDADRAIVPGQLNRGNLNAAYL